MTLTTLEPFEFRGIAVAEPLKFGPGLTLLSGPERCGKSTILDYVEETHAEAFRPPVRTAPQERAAVLGWYAPEGGVQLGSKTYQKELQAFLQEEFDRPDLPFVLVGDALGALKKTVARLGREIGAAKRSMPKAVPANVQREIKDLESKLAEYDQRLTTVDKDRMWRLYCAPETLAEYDEMAERREYEQRRYDKATKELYAANAVCERLNAALQGGAEGACPTCGRGGFDAAKVLAEARNTRKLWQGRVEKVSNTLRVLVHDMAKIERESQPNYRAWQTRLRELEGLRAAASRREEIKEQTTQATLRQETLKSLQTRIKLAAESAEVEAMRAAMDAVNGFVRRVAPEISFELWQKQGGMQWGLRRGDTEVVTTLSGTERNLRNLGLAVAHAERTGRTLLLDDGDFDGLEIDRMMALLPALTDADAQIILARNQRLDVEKPAGLKAHEIYVPDVAVLEGETE